MYPQVITFLVKLESSTTAMNAQVVISVHFVSSFVCSRVRKEDGEFRIEGRTINFGVICFRGYYPDSK
jgi:hypothetical protein